MLVLLSTVVGAVLVVGGFEAAARVRYAHWRTSYNTGRWFFKVLVASSNPVLGWEYRRGRVRAGDVRINEYGFREREGVKLEKRPEVLRVAFVGDSITLGMGVPEPQTFVRRIDVLANRSSSSPPVEALNFGVGGYDAVQVAELLRTRVMAFGPGSVVYVLCWNDFDFGDEASRSMVLYFKPPRSFFLAALRQARRRLSGEEYHHAHFAETRDVVFAKIREMGEVVAARHGRFLVAIVPVFSPCRPGGPELAESWDPDPLEDLREVLVGFLRANAIPFVDLRTAFRASGLPPDRVAQDVWHPNEEGSRIVAEALLTPILQPSAPEP